MNNNPSNEASNEILEQKIYDELSVLFAGKDLSDEQYNSLMDDRKESVELIMRLITHHQLKLLQRVEDDVITAKEKEVIGSWEKHAYSMDSYVNDALVYQKHPNADQSRRENDVTDRRAILLSHGLVKEQLEAIKRIRTSIEKGEV